MKKLAALSFIAMMFCAAHAAPPEQTWKQGHIKDNAAYATDQHAILKINDAAYIHAGETVSLGGQPAKPESWQWVKGVQKSAGIRTGGDEEDDLEAEPDSTPDPTAKDPKLAKLLRGLKLQGLQKAIRWLGQQFLKHIFKEWRKAVGLPEQPEDEPTVASPKALTQAVEMQASL